MRNAVIGLTICICLSACSGPIGPIPGGELDGVEFPWPDDWEFTNAEENVLLQTNPNDPYSVTIWCVTLNDKLYFAAANTESTWVLNMAENPQVILSVGGKLIEGRAERIGSDSSEVNDVIQAYLKKYEIESEEDFVQEDGALFRLNKP